MGKKKNNRRRPSTQSHNETRSITPPKEVSLQRPSEVLGTIPTCCEPISQEVKCDGNANSAPRAVDLSLTHDGPTTTLPDVTGEASRSSVAGSNKASNPPVSNKDQVQPASAISVAEPLAQDMSLQLESKEQLATGEAEEIAIPVKLIQAPKLALKMQEETAQPEHSSDFQTSVDATCTAPDREVPSFLVCEAIRSPSAASQTSAPEVPGVTRPRGLSSTPYMSPMGKAALALMPTQFALTPTLESQSESSYSTQREQTPSPNRGLAQQPIGPVSAPQNSRIEEEAKVESDGPWGISVVDLNYDPSIEDGQEPIEIFSEDEEEDRSPRHNSNESSKSFGAEGMGADGTIGPLPKHPTRTRAGNRSLIRRAIKTALTLRTSDGSSLVPKSLPAISAQVVDVAKHSASVITSLATAALSTITLMPGTSNQPGVLSPDPIEVPKPKLATSLVSESEERAGTPTVMTSPNPVVTSSQILEHSQPIPNPLSGSPHDGLVLSPSDPRWQHDTDVHECYGCQAKFGWMLRKHHCRFCGRIFCHPCSSTVLRGHRVCSRCADVHAQPL